MTGTCVSCKACCTDPDVSEYFCKHDRKKVIWEMICRHTPSRFEKTDTEGEAFEVLEDVE